MAASAIALADISHIRSISDKSALSLQFDIITLPDPANDATTTTTTTTGDGAAESSMREYVLLSSRTKQLSIHEIQTVLPHSGKFASHFVGSRIISNPLLHVTTRVDPLFFALARLGGAGRPEKWQPIDQTLAHVPSTIMTVLHLPTSLASNGVGQIGQLSHLLDVSNMCGGDLILCKFSKERTLKWLVAKFERSVEVLRRRLSDKKRRASKKSYGQRTRGESGAFSSSFSLAESEGPNDAESTRSDATKDSNGEKREIISFDLSKEEEQSISVDALQLVCDYLSTEWKENLCKEVGLTHGNLIGKKKIEPSPTSDGQKKTVISGEKRARGQEDADALLQYTTGSNDLKAITREKKQKCVAKSVGLKRLAKVNTKGMKSMTSFFGTNLKKK